MSAISKLYMNRAVAEAISVDPMKLVEGVRHTYCGVVINLTEGGPISVSKDGWRKEVRLGADRTHMHTFKEVKQAIQRRLLILSLIKYVRDEFKPKLNSLTRAKSPRDGHRFAVPTSPLMTICLEESYEYTATMSLEENAVHITALAIKKGISLPNALVEADKLVKRLLKEAEQIQSRTALSQKKLNIISARLSKLGYTVDLQDRLLQIDMHKSTATLVIECNRMGQLRTGFCETEDMSVEGLEEFSKAIAEIKAPIDVSTSLKPEAKKAGEENIVTDVTLV